MSVYFDGDGMKVMVMPKIIGEKNDDNKIKPFTISGTPQKIDENFIGAFETFIEVINEYNTNMDEIKKMLEQKQKMN
jgi:PRTRC genetic system protein E